MKSLVAWKNLVSNCGYVGMGRESLDPSNSKRDGKEAFNIGNEEERRKYGEENLWTKETNEEDRRVLCRFFEEAHLVLHTLSNFFDTSSLSSLVDCLQNGEKSKTGISSNCILCVFFFFFSSSKSPKGQLLGRDFVKYCRRMLS